MYQFPKLSWLTIIIGRLLKKNDDNHTFFITKSKSSWLTSIVNKNRKNRFLTSIFFNFNFFCKIMENQRFLIRSSLIGGFVIGGIGCCFYFYYRYISNSSKSSNEQTVTPWDVDGNGRAIDYDKLIKKFGTRPIDKELLQRFETLTGKKCHTFLRRGIFFSHRCFICLQFHNSNSFFILLIGDY